MRKPQPPPHVELAAVLNADAKDKKTYTVTTINGPIITRTFEVEDSFFFDKWGNLCMKFNGGSGYIYAVRYGQITENGKEGWALFDTSSSIIFGRSLDNPLTDVKIICDKITIKAQKKDGTFVPEIFFLDKNFIEKQKVIDEFHQLIGIPK